jgi:hypothetical protein
MFMRVAAHEVTRLRLMLVVWLELILPQLLALMRLQRLKVERLLEV